MTRLLVAGSPGEVRIAVMDDRLLDYTIDRDSAPDGVGDLYRARVIARLPALGGSFVSLGSIEAFLPDSEAPNRPVEGDGVIVRITRAAQNAKGPRVSARLAADAAGFTDTSSPGLIRRGPDAIARLASAYPDAPILIDDAGRAAALPAPLRARSRVVNQAFDEDVAAEIDALAERDVVMPGGARFSIHPTPALVAIDLDLGSAASARQGKLPAQQAANRLIIPELARQIRLRNLSGAILVDWAGLSPQRRRALRPDVEAALAADPLAPRLIGFTGLGLAEIFRPRIHPPLAERLAGPHAAGLSALRRWMADLAATPARPLALRAAPAVISTLQTDLIACAQFQQRTGRPVQLRSDPSLPPDAWRLESA